MSLLGVLAVAGSGMTAESERLTTVASNLANANTMTSSTGQPYRAREVVFQAVPVGDTDGDGDGTAASGEEGVRVAGVVQSDAPMQQVYDPGSSYANANGYVEMPNVSPVDEMVNMLSAQQNYQADLEAFNVAKTLALHTLSI